MSRGRLLTGGYPLGVAFLMLAGVALSSGGYLLRAVESADGWQILFYRSAAFTVTSFLFTLTRHGRRTPEAFREIGLPGLIAALSLGLGFIFYLMAILMTTVANVVVLLSLGPFCAAILAWMVLGERVRGRTWVAMLAALAGVGLMVLDGLGSGGIEGILVAILAPVSFAVMVVAVRRRADRDMTPMLPLAGLLATFIALPFCKDLSLSAHDLALALVLGAVQIGVSFILITLGTRWVPAAQVPLLTLTETVLAPIWVWLAFAEVPTVLALSGAAIVLAAVVAEAIAGLRGEAGKRRRSVT